ncbi:MAG: hypothetical protein AAB325_18200, partial [Pseudomonadota bacterium]
MPTAALSPGASQPAKAWAALIDAYERLDGWWRSKVVDYSLRDQFLLAQALVAQPTITRTESSS